MADLVGAGEIERIVGVRRHPTEHWARAVSSEQTVYILHSQECLNSGVDLRECEYSLALDAGIIRPTLWPSWVPVLDRPVRIVVFGGFLIPVVSVGWSDDEPS